MDDDFAQINEHPFTGLFAFGRNYLKTGFARLVLNIARQRAYLAIGVATGNDDAFKQRCQFFSVDDFNIAALDVLERGNGNFFNLIGNQWVLGSPGKVGVR